MAGAPAPSRPFTKGSCRTTIDIANRVPQTCSIGSLVQIRGGITSNLFPARLQY